MSFWRSGNVLFLILLAVALFAALSYAVTQAGRGGGKDISDEQARIIASQITQYFTNIEQAVARLRLINSCKDKQISFNYDSDGDGIYIDSGDRMNNSNAPINLTCHIFHPNGGGLSYIDPPDDWLDANESSNISYGLLAAYGNICIPNIGTTLGNCLFPTSNNQDDELVIIAHYVPESVCAEINKAATGDPAINQGSTTVGSTREFDGNYRSTRILDQNSGQSFGCFENITVGTEFPSVGSYHAYHVLIPR